ncbi:hypothetical protein UCD39_19040 [Nitrospirillum sp. BR 11752]|uniref:Uncharacterized protein n=1 Tax=Nitrospirillum amazonense TaxID=28077 RepID=A0A560H6V0_9PROT|nr:hypothetical protein [Nitrospirillum amazonense]MEE3626051.1 hypothetical protein [Nitrospirillum sp. BR 11752]TWB41881.1 hypothetical protein FBZ90_107257 [Nitrospirillum amazonense]
MSLLDAPHRDETLSAGFLTLGASLAGAPTTHTQAPLKPTTEMLAAGARAGGVSVATAWAIYTSMLKSA